MKKRRMKHKVSRFISVFLLLSFVTIGISTLPNAGSMSVQAASTHKTGGHRIVSAPERRPLIELEGEDAKKIKMQARQSPAYQLGQYSNLLSDTEKAYYQLVVAAFSNYAPYGTNYDDAMTKYGVVREISSTVYNQVVNMSSTDYQNFYQHVIEATEYDHVENVEYYMSYIQDFEYIFADGKYYVKAVAIATTSDNYKAMNQKIRSARNRFLASIPACSTDAEWEVRIHDALIDNVTYSKRTDTDLIFTAYAALVEGDAVCDGYAQAFAYLLNAKNIDAFVVTGGVGESESIAKKQGHAWNRVKIGSAWYEVDPTWDDVDKNDVDMRHNFFNITTHDIENQPYSPYNHLRMDPYIGKLMVSPTATGTADSYGILKANHPDWFESTPVTSLKTDIDSLTLKVGESSTVTATVLPDNATNKYVKWVSSDSSIADVKDGVITGISKGTATIYAISGSNSSIKKGITVEVVVPVTGLTLNQTNVSIHQGEAYALIANIIPSDANNQTVIWSSSDPAIATVENGKVTGLSVGTAIITAVSDANNSITAACTVKVSQPAGATITTGEENKACTFTVLNPDENTVAFIGTADRDIKSLTIPTTVTDSSGKTYTTTEIGKNALKKYKKLSKVTFPKTVTIIRKNACKGCSRLKKITLYGDSLTKIESGAFSGISKDATIIIKTSSKSKFNKLVKKLKKAGAKNATYKRK